MPDCVQDVYMNVIFGTQQEDFPLNVWTNLGKIFAQQRRKTNLHVVFGDKELENYAHYFPSQTYFQKSMNRCLGSLKGQGRLQIWTAQEFMYREKGVYVLLKEYVLYSWSTYSRHQEFRRVRYAGVDFVCVNVGIENFWLLWLRLYSCRAAIYDFPWMGQLIGYLYFFTFFNWRSIYSCITYE